MLVDPATGRPLITGSLDRPKPSGKNGKNGKKVKRTKKPRPGSTPNTSHQRAPKGKNVTKQKKLLAGLLVGVAIVVAADGLYLYAQNNNGALPWTEASAPSASPQTSVPIPTSTLSAEELEAARQRVLVARVTGENLVNAGRLAGQFGYGLKLTKKNGQTVDEIVSPGETYLEAEAEGGIIVSAAFATS